LSDCSGWPKKTVISAAKSWLMTLATAFLPSSTRVSIDLRRFCPNASSAFFSSGPLTSNFTMLNLNLMSGSS
jgi:hypothetical protein